jgi:hypothetical protein
VIRVTDGSGRFSERCSEDLLHKKCQKPHIAAIRFLGWRQRTEIIEIVSYACPASAISFFRRLRP